MIQRFITIDNQILMACTGNEIKVMYAHENPIISRIHNHMPQSQSRSGRLVLRIEDRLLKAIEHKYMIGIKRTTEFRQFVFPVPSFELAIVEGDTTDRNTWKMQCMWEGCAIDVLLFKPEPDLILNDDELVMHLLPINFTEEKRNDSWTDR